MLRCTLLFVLHWLLGTTRAGALTMNRATQEVTPTLNSPNSGIDWFKHPWWCPTFAKFSPVQENFVADVPFEKHYGSKYVGWWNIKPSLNNNVLADIQGRLSPVNQNDFNADFRGMKIPGRKYNAGKAAAVARAMYEGTKVPGVNTPEKLKGVFWMKGNGNLEELVSLQYGEWFADQKVWVTPVAPFSWSWPLTLPRTPPSPGLYALPQGVREAFVNGTAALWGAGPYVQAVKMEACAEANCKPGQSFARQQFFTLGRADNIGVTNLGDVPVNIAEGILAALLKLPSGTLPRRVVSGDFDLREVSTDGSHWKRDIKWGIMGCNFIPFGGYDLVKIIDANGNPLEPHWSEWIKYAGDSDHVVWSGWEDATAMANAKEFHKKNMDDLWKRVEESGII